MADFFVVASDLNWTTIHVAIADGHSFILFLDEGFYPLNVLNTLKMVPEVCRISVPLPT